MCSYWFEHREKYVSYTFAIRDYQDQHFWLYVFPSFQIKNKINIISSQRGRRKGMNIMLQHITQETTTERNHKSTSKSYFTEYLIWRNIFIFFIITLNTDRFKNLSFYDPEWWKIESSFLILLSRLDLLVMRLFSFGMVESWNSISDGSVGRESLTPLGGYIILV